MLKYTALALAASSLVAAAPSGPINRVNAPAARNEKRQAYQTHNLTPDGYWHNRYHALLSMAAYGDYDVTCPNQTFTMETLLKNFPNTNYTQPWEVVSRFGPTPSGAEGFTAIVPEMNKALIIFKGNLTYEQNLPTETVSWAEGFNVTGTCQSCTVNAFAAQGYMEAVAETNNFEAIRERYYGAGLVFSIAGHGLGGMHSLIASAALNAQNIAYYSHTYGAPRTFNPAGAYWYNIRFNGEAGERGIFNDDQMSEIIPASDDYAHAGTTFHYHGMNATSGQPNMEICWKDDLRDMTDDPTCAPAPGGTTNTTPLQDHFFYFANVQQCGGRNTPSLDLINAYLDEAGFEDEAVGSDPVTTTSSRRGGGPRTSSSSSSTRSSSSSRSSSTHSSSSTTGAPTPMRPSPRS